MEKLKDRNEELEQKHQEMSLKFESLESSYQQMSAERQGSHSKIQELAELLSKRVVESNNEKKTMRDFLIRMEREKGLLEKQKQATNEQAQRQMARPPKELSLYDYFVRLKTTSISSDKFAETLDILFEILTSDRKQNADVTSTSAKQIEKQLLQEDNYRLLLKAFPSKNNRVLSVLYNLVQELGGIQDKVPMFLETLASAALVKTYKSNQDYGVKQQALKFLKIMCENSTTTAIEMEKYGAVQTIIDDLQKYTKGTNMLSSYLTDLLALLSMVARQDQGIAEFLSPSCMNCLVLCLRSDKPVNAAHVMNSMIYLSKTQDNRSILSNYDVFNTIMSNLVSAHEKKSRVLLNAAIAGLAHFSLGKSYRVLLSTANNLFPFFQLLIACIASRATVSSENPQDLGLTTLEVQQGHEVPATTRYAAAVLVHKLISDKDLNTLDEQFLKEGLLLALARASRTHRLRSRKNAPSLS